MDDNKRRLNDETKNQLGGKISDTPYINEEEFPNLFEMEKASLLLVRKVKNIRTQNNSIIIQTEGRFFEKKYSYRYLDARPFFDETEDTRNICVCLTFCTEDIVRIQASESIQPVDKKTEMVVGEFDKHVDVLIQENEESIILKTDKLYIVIQKDPWNLYIKDKSNHILYKQFSEETRSFVKFEVCPFGFLFDPVTKEKYACEAVYFKDTEHFYGFGEKFGQLDKKGQDIKLWNRDARSVYTERSWKNIPFFISSEGYGVFYNTSYKLNCNMGEHFFKAYSVMSGQADIDYYFIYGPTIKEILPKYTDITGKPGIPPKWSFGLWMSKLSYGTRQEVEAVAERLRSEKVSCDVIHIDTNWFEEDWICNWKFGSKRFPEAGEMLDKMSELGFKITLWQLPYIEKGNAEYDVYDEGKEKGYFALRPEGGMEFPHGLLDLSNPEAVEWYKYKLLKPLLDMGVAGIKVDFGEAAAPFYKYCGYDGKEMHNLYPLLYNKVVYEITEEVKGKGEAIIWARSTWAGSQRYPVHWGGDSGTDFTALANSIKAGLGFGLSGFPFWSHDIGGFFFETNPVLYARWAQVGFFSSHARTHGFYTREPWSFGEEVFQIFKKYNELRYRLIPYIYSTAVKAAENSLPLLRALVVEYQGDPAVYTIDNQYLFGDSFLVAPILDDGNTREIYLPEGVWNDYWDHTQYRGKQWIRYEAGLDRLPLFVKENAIIPMGPVMNYIDELPCNPVTLDLYPVVGTAFFELVEGEKEIKLCMHASEYGMEVFIPACGLNFELKINNVKPYTSLFVNQVPWEGAEYEDGMLYLKGLIVLENINIKLIYKNS